MDVQKNCYIWSKIVGLIILETDQPSPSAAMPSKLLGRIRCQCCRLLIWDDYSLIITKLLVWFHWLSWLTDLSSWMNEWLIDSVTERPTEAIIGRIDRLFQPRDWLFAWLTDWTGWTQWLSDWMIFLVESNNRSITQCSQSLSPVNQSVTQSNQGLSGSITLIPICSVHSLTNLCSGEASQMSA